METVIGFALLKNEKVIMLEKGINLDVRDIAKTIAETDYDWCLFHTRLATFGEKNDENCHPFKRRNIVMAMNGSEPSVSFMAKVLHKTDTEAILDLICTYKLSLNSLQNFNSIFMGFSEGNPFVVANNLQRIELLMNKKSKSIVFASSFPTTFKKNIYVPKETFIWRGEKIPDIFRKHVRNCKKTIFFDDYIYHNDLYGQCYVDVIDGKGGKVYGM